MKLKLLIDGEDKRVRITPETEFDTELLGMLSKMDRAEVKANLNIHFASYKKIDSIDLHLKDSIMTPERVTVGAMMGGGGSGIKYRDIEDKSSLEKFPSMDCAFLRGVGDTRSSYHVEKVQKVPYNRVNLIAALRKNRAEQMTGKGEAYWNSVADVVESFI